MRAGSIGGIVHEVVVSHFAGAVRGFAFRRRSRRRCRRAGRQPAAHAADAALGAVDHEALLNAKLAGLKAGLGLNPDQEKLWGPFEAAVRDAAQLHMQHMKDRMERMHGMAGPDMGEDEEEGEQASPIDRLEAMADHLSEAGAAMKKVADAAKPLYASLDDTQKRLFVMLSRDMMMLGHGHGGMMERRRDNGMGSWPSRLGSSPSRRGGSRLRSSSFLLPEARPGSRSSLPRCGLQSGGADAACALGRKRASGRKAEGGGERHVLKGGPGDEEEDGEGIERRRHAAQHRDAGAWAPRELGEGGDRRADQRERRGRAADLWAERRRGRGSGRRPGRW